MVILNHSNFLRPIDNDVIVILLYFIFIGEYFFLLSLGTGLECKVNIPYLSMFALDGLNL